MKIKQFREWQKDDLVWLFLIALIIFKFRNYVIPKAGIYWGEDFVELVGMRDYFYHQLQKGTLFLWDYLSTTGMLYSIADSGVFYPFDLLFGYLSPHYFEPYRFSLIHIAHFVLTGGFTYLYTRQLGLSRTSALVSSITFMLGGFMLAHAGHRNIIQTVTWFPLGLYFLDKALLQKKILWASLAGLVLGVSFLAGHANIYYFILFFLFLYYCFRVFQGIKKRSLTIIFQDTFYFLIAGLFVLGISAIQLFPALGGSIKSHQASLPFEWKIQSSFSIFNLIHFLFPDYTVWAALDIGEQYSYMGILPLILGLWAIIRSKDTRVKFFGFVALLTFLMALGDLTPVYRFFYDNFPGINLFRIPARINILFVFSLSVLAGFGCHLFLLNEPDPCSPKSWKSIKVLHYLLGGAGILVVLYLGIWLYQERQDAGYRVAWIWNLLSKDFYLFLIFLATSYLILLRRIKGGPKTIIKTSMILLICLDLGHETYLRKEPPPVSYSPQVIIKELKKDPTLFRICNKEGYLSSLLRYREKIFAYDTDSIPNYAGRLISNENLHILFLAEKNPMLLDLLNVKYYIGSKPKMNNGLEIIKIGGTFENNREIELKSPTKISRMALTTFLSHAPLIPQGTIVAQVSLDKKDGSHQTIPIRAGIETAEWAIDRPGLKSLHQKAQIEKSWKMRQEGFQAHSYIFTKDFPEPLEVSKIRLLYLSSQGSLLIKKISVNGVELKDLQKEHFQLMTPNIYKNPSCLPRVFMIGRAKVFSDENELLEQLEQLDPRETILVSQLPAGYHEPVNPSFSDQEASINQYSPDRIIITTKATEDKFLILSDTYSPYWEATIDQKSFPILKVNGSLRGLYVPKGDHRIEFSFHFPLIYYGLAISCITLITIISLMFGVIALGYQRKKKAFNEIQG